ncbi:MAG: LysR family transcriptional regulator [Opitutaceae bacterium]|nr:LysR family transcriptional regulator [Opitutaceae bacterium]
MPYAECAVNVHHLELFYYVARHGGISSAVRHMPYGIQQPAVSAQILQLEKDLGVKLFERQPFRLSDAGHELMEFVEPFFGRIDEVARRLRDGASPQLRVGASEVVLRTHFPAVLERLRNHHPRVRLGLRSGFDTDLAIWLREGEVDLIITPLHGRPPPTVQSLTLIHLPVVLLVPKKWPIRSAAELWASRRPEPPLISMPPRESICVLFQRGLRKRGIDWPVTIEASSIDLITQYVAAGRGAGLSLMMKELVNNPGVRVLPLDDFERLEIAALWRGEGTPLLRAFLNESSRYAHELWPEFAVAVGKPARVVPRATGNGNAAGPIPVAPAAAGRPVARIPRAVRPARRG